MRTPILFAVLLLATVGSPAVLASPAVRADAPSGHGAVSAVASFGEGAAGTAATDGFVASSARAVPTAGTRAIVENPGTAGGALQPGTSMSLGRLVPVPLPIADEVIVRKSQRRLYLMKDGRVLRSFHISLGLMPKGPKRRSGDFRTPEGLYYLTRRNPRSDYFLSILVSYPNAQDVARARRERVDPGGAIMVHGVPNVMMHKPRYYATSDWTDGCIALSDSDMVEVWLMTRDDTPIDILP